MKKPMRTLVLILVVQITGPICFSESNVNSVQIPLQQSQVEDGQQLFVHDFSQPDQWPLAEQAGTGGDGLGPMFNGVSCASCHKLAGVGGAGPLDKNVDLLSLVLPKLATAAVHKSIVNRGRKVHPGFSRANTDVVLHRFGHDGDGKLDAYALWRDRLVGKDDLNNWPLSLERPLRRIGTVDVRLSQRNTPALFGAGIVDAIPMTAIIEVSRQQAKQFPEISGRVSGRFGWRGQVMNLREFVLMACSNELGLQVTRHDQAANPMIPGTKTKTRNKRRDKVPVDLTRRQTAALTQFVASLPAPRRIKFSKIEDTRFAVAGEKHFNRIGCAVCHVRKLGRVDGIFSDLLLHDMGPKLADPVAAIAEAIGTHGLTAGYTQSSPVRISPLQITTNITQEWRTPPLWGVRDSAPYLHDGRAVTLDEAIRWHAGESRSVTTAYLSMPTQQREQLLAFLNSLAAPVASKSVAAK